HVALRAIRRFASSIALPAPWSSALSLHDALPISLRNELQEAMRDDQLFLNYQPKVDRYGRFCGLEALVRWRHPSKGLISPARFRSEEHTSELQSRENLVCRLLLEKKNTGSIDADD